MGTNSRTNQRQARAASKNGESTAPRVYTIVACPMSALSSTSLREAAGDLGPDGGKDEASWR